MNKLLHQHSRYILLFLLCGLSYLLLTSCGSLPQAHAASKTPQKCGTITLSPIGKLLDPSKIAPHNGSCFEQAYQHCQPATLIFTHGGIDTVTIHTFTVSQKQHPCSVTDLLQYRVIPGPLHTTGTYTCSNVNITKDALFIKHCNTEGTISIPLHTT
jgi:hypothetical protein